MRQEAGGRGATVLKIKTKQEYRWRPM